MELARAKEEVAVALGQWTKRRGQRRRWRQRSKTAEVGVGIF
jgi:hypothetical protein